MKKKKTLLIIFLLSPLFLLTNCDSIVSPDKGSVAFGDAQTGSGEIVVTVYFCGTTITRDWWDTSKQPADGFGGFGSPELVSSLHHEQKTETDSVFTHYKFIVNGVGSGTGVPIADLLSTIDPSSPLNPRGWIKCLEEGKSHVDNIISSTSGQIILNIVGHSRGAILSILLSHEFEDNSRISRINVLVFDPVSGDSNPLVITRTPASKFAIPSIVSNFVGIFASDETSHYFEPTIPVFKSSSTKQWLFRVPGSHETLVGNVQRDGHGVNFIWLPLASHNGSLDFLEQVPRSTKVIAVKLLGSPAWGGAEFNNDCAEVNNATFVKNYDAMVHFPDYEYIRGTTFLPDGMYTWHPHLVLFKNVYNINWVTINEYIHPWRYQLSSRGARVTVKNGNTFSIKNDALNDNVNTQSGSAAWKKIQEIGGY